jgi:hypothetical protein
VILYIEMSAAAKLLVGARIKPARCAAR